MKQCGDCGRLVVRGKTCVCVLKRHNRLQYIKLESREWIYWEAVGSDTASGDKKKR